MNLTEEEWKKRLTPEEFYVLRQKGTERPFTGKFYKLFEEGIYVCKGCGNELFDSESKFDSHCGWPSYDRTLSPGSIVEKPDYSYGMIRTEVLCSRCGGHLGHVFDDGPTSTGLRYCINSVAIDFKKKDK
ncbi:MAG: peptide-methionine (R)-S-oxide reductase MsrB [Thermaurantimonas sp.]